ncbi:MAG: hypothetical protein KDK07_25165 [Bauldia sp.]|nr:hypothetical protein [Bauldia sp.]
MTGELFRARTGSPIRKAGSEPPGYERVAGAFRQSGQWLAAIGFLAAAASLVFFAAGMSGVTGSAWLIFVYAAGFMLVVSLLPLALGYRRIRRVAFLGRLRDRWIQLDRVGDPDDQIATLRRAYGGLIANDVVARVGVR